MKLSFFLAALGYLGLTVFVFLNYPAAWRKNRLFVTLLTLWHLLGAAAVVTVFTAIRYLPYENLRIEICRVATFYYIPITLLSLFFLLRLIFSRSFLFLLERSGRSLSPGGRRWFADRQVHAILFAVLAFLLCTLGYFNVDFLRLTRYEVQVAAPSEEKELTVCLIADVHAGSGTWAYTYEDLAQLIDRCDADVLLIAGDLFDETSSARDEQEVARVLSGIRRPRYGVYAIYGNHDSRDPDRAELLRSLGVTVLEDDLALLGRDIQLIGSLDPSHRGLEPEALFRQLSPDPQKPILLLTHRPRGFAQWSALGCDLAMAGHTHGFNIPQYLGANLLEDMYAGCRRYGDMTAVTTSGVGAWGFHYKFPAKSEVVCLHITFADPAQ